MNVKRILMMTPQGGNGGGMFSTVIMFSLIILIFYFLILRPSRSGRKTARNSWRASRREIGLLRSEDCTELSSDWKRRLFSSRWPTT